MTIKNERCYNNSMNDINGIVKFAEDIDMAPKKESVIEYVGCSKKDGWKDHFTHKKNIMKGLKMVD